MGFFGELREIGKSVVDLYASLKVLESRVDTFAVAVGNAKDDYDRFKSRVEDMLHEMRKDIASINGQLAAQDDIRKRVSDLEGRIARFETAFAVGVADIVKTMRTSGASGAPRLPDEAQRIANELRLANLNIVESLGDSMAAEKDADSAH